MARIALVDYQDGIVENYETERAFLESLSINDGKKSIVVMGVEIRYNTIMEELEIKQAIAYRGLRVPA